MKVRDVTPETFEANKELRKAVPGARTKQRQDQEAKKKSNERLDLDIKKTRQWKVTSEICHFSYKMILRSWCQEELKRRSLNLAFEAMSLKKKTDEKLKEIEKLDEVIEDLGKHSKQIGKEK